MTTLPRRPASETPEPTALSPAYTPLLDGLREWLDRHDYTGHSRTTYLSLLHRFLKHLDGWEIPFEELTPEDLQAFFTEAALQPASRNLYLVMLGHLYESLGRTDDSSVVRYKTQARHRRGRPARRPAQVPGPGSNPRY